MTETKEKNVVRINESLKGFSFMEKIIKEDECEDFEYTLTMDKCTYDTMQLVMDKFGIKNIEYLVLFLATMGYEAKINAIIPIDYLEELNEEMSQLYELLHKMDEKLIRRNLVTGNFFDKAKKHGERQYNSLMQRIKNKTRLNNILHNN